MDSVRWLSPTVSSAGFFILFSCLYFGFVYFGFFWFGSLPFMGVFPPLCRVSGVLLDVFAGLCCSLCLEVSHRRLADKLSLVARL